MSLGSRSNYSPWVKLGLAAFGPSRDGVALDLGCGRGRHSRMLARRFKAIDAIDCDAGALSDAQRHARRSRSGARIRWRCADGAAWCQSQPRGHYDLLLLVHLWLPGLWSSALRLVKSGGVAVLETPPAHGENWYQLPRCNQLLAEFRDLRLCLVAGEIVHASAGRVDPRIAARLVVKKI